MGKRTAVVVGSLVAAVVLCGIALALKPDDSKRVVTAEEFEIVDKDGNRRLTMNMNQDGDPSIALFDKKGELRVSLGMNKGGGPVLILKDQAQLILMDGERKRRLFLYTDKNGDPHFLMFNREDKPAFRAPDSMPSLKEDHGEPATEKKPSAEKEKSSKGKKK